MAAPAGRTDDMLIIRGVNVYPSQVEAIMLELSELTPNYRIVVERTGTLDTAAVEIETAHASEELRERAERRLVESIGCSIAVHLQPPGTVPRSEGGKLQRVEDRR
jgi:phenylacetate-CoA ligase